VVGQDIFPRLELRPGGTLVEITGPVCELGWHGAPCDLLRPHADWKVSRFLSRFLADTLIFPKNTAVVLNPTRGAFFAGCRTGSHGAAPSTDPVGT
jgi:hypothetical protein